MSYSCITEHHIPSLDQENKIEKPVANLVAYDKTKELKPGKSEEVTLTFTWDDLTSYCYTYDNGNGTMGCYMLEAGDYTISLRSDSHNVIDEQQIQRAETIWYDGSTRITFARQKKMHSLS